MERTHEIERASETEQKQEEPKVGAQGGRDTDPAADAAPGPETGDETVILPKVKK